MGIVVREFAHQAAQDRGRFCQHVEAIESVVFRHAIYPTIFSPPTTCRTLPMSEGTRLIGAQPDNLAPAMIILSNRMSHPGRVLRRSYPSSVVIKRLHRARRKA